MRRRLPLPSRRKKIGAPPGTLIHVGEKRAEQSRIRLVDFDESRLEERLVEDIAACRAYRDRPTVTWINIDGLHDVEVIDRIGQCFDIHPLVLEDILNTEHRPKIEGYGDYVFCVVKMLAYDAERREIRGEQVSLIFGRGFVLSFQEREGDVFEPVRERIRGQRGRLRRMGADYLAYALLDAIVDSYYDIIEGTEERIDLLEGDLVTNPVPATLEHIRSFQRDMIFFRKAAAPLPNIISWLQRLESPLISTELDFFLRDVHDHTVHILDTVETFRETVFNMFNLYVSSLSNRMNEIMRVLAIIATIFIPLTFIAGVYGMNFRYMPELGWKWSYPVLWMLMIAIAVGMVLYFKRKKWF